MAIIKRVWWIAFTPTYIYKRTGSRSSAMSLLAFSSIVGGLSDY